MRAMADTLNTLCTLAMQVAMPRLEALCAGAGIPALSQHYAPTKLLMERIHAGDKADMAFLTAEAADELVQAGQVAPGDRADLAVSLVGVAVRAGAPKPDISTAAAFVQTLRSAKTIAYSRAGASGIYFAGLIERLGIAAEVNAKATVIPAGFTAELAANGSCEIAIQQVSELMAVPGVDIVGPLPKEVETRAMFTGVVLGRGAQTDAARKALALLASPAAAEAFRLGGLVPANG